MRFYDLKPDSHNYTKTLPVSAIINTKMHQAAKIMYTMPPLRRKRTAVRDAGRHIQSISPENMEGLF